MGKLRPRYNEKARAGSHLAKTAKPHPAARDGGLRKLAQSRKPAQATPADTSNFSRSETMGADDDVSYSASASAIPDVIIPGETKMDLSMLPEEPTGKLTSKKKKRLEKFIEKQLKKDERVHLLKKLQETPFSSGLLRSSKAFGQTKLTAREKLRQALLEERAGVPRTDTSILLTKEVDVEEYMAEDGQSDAEEAKPSADRVITPIVEVATSAQPKESLSLLARAFGAAEAGPVAVQVFDKHAGKGELPAAPPVFGSSLKPTFGGALKRKAEDGAEAAFVIPKRKKGKQNKKPAPVAVKDSDLDSDGHSEDAGSASDDSSEKDGDADAESEDEEESRVGPFKKKDMWAANVVGGEELPGKTMAAADAAAVAAAAKTSAKKANSIKATAAKPTAKRTFHVPVHRPEAIQLARISLPVVMEEQPIMEAIFKNDVTILCGETGSGKTTQVPQFLYESGFGDPTHPEFPGMVGITQPRRVAAMSMARRVADEMALKKGEVTYQVRYDKGDTGSKTRIKFMTDGILLRELSVAAGGEKQPGHTGAPADLLLSKYSCIIIDEAHERTIGTDVLIGWLTRIVSLRNSGKVAGVKPLKLVIMSATLRVEDFTMNTTLFPVAQRPPVVKVDGRQHKVVIHYNKKTPEIDYGSEALKKISKIHMKLPPGGILVFMSGQQEIQVLVRKLRKEFPLPKAKVAAEEVSVAKAPGSESLFEEADEAADVEMGRDVDDFDDADLDDDEDDEEEAVEVLGGLSDDEEAAAPIFTPPANKSEAMPLHVLPLYSLLPTEAQMRVFDAPPPGTRLVVVATNVAETSLTIPGIKYVVDCGKVKERRFDTHSGVQTYQVCWTSRASADQRAGRAGRTGPGHCYRLFSSAVFNDYFEQFSQPEILRIPIEGVVLQMKSMGINNVVGFPFPTPPGHNNLRSAEKLLSHLNAVDADPSTNVFKITELGRIMAKFPVSPRYAKMIIVAASQPGNILAYTIAVVAGLSVGDPFIRDEDIIGRIADSDDEEYDEGDEEKQARNQKRAAFWKTMLLFSGNPPTSDALRLLTAIGAYTAESVRRNGSPDAFCDKHFLRAKAMEEMRKLRQQLTNLVKTSLADAMADNKTGRKQQKQQLYPAVADLCVDPMLPPPSPRESAAILQVILAGFADRVARLDEATSKGCGGKKYVPVYRTMTGGKNEVCRIHPASCLYRERPAPRYVVYEELQGREEKISNDNSGIVATRASAVGLKAADGTDLTSFWMKGVTAVDERWIATVAPRSLCRMGKVVEQPEPKWDPVGDKITGLCVPNFGPKIWELPAREVELPRLEDRCKWLARRLVEGKIPLMDPALVASSASGATPSKRKTKKKTAKQTHIEIFDLLKPFLATKTVTITKEWGKSQPKVHNLVSALVAAKVDSRQTLLAHWRKSPTFLLSAYLLWVPDEFHAALRQYWPPAALYGPDDDEGEKDVMRRGELCRSVQEIAESGAAGRRKREEDAKIGGDLSDGGSDF
ncbi:P-loop containing nucleoside triphosphate hydrolase protein [Geranomyces variabilis]|nr:P-loop containing nucleoside triphosphate hydrolase protein [Geranomyces variabilis]KAJ3132360.1 ATP-dependent RNA helicase dhx37 [Geranomyces variabilis]